MNKSLEIERSIITKHRKHIWRNFIRAVEKYELVDENDKIMVCLSGGKDSFLLAKCLEELQKHGNVSFELKFVLMNPGYKSEVIKKIKENAKKLNIDLIIFKSDIFKVVEKIASSSPCYMCARMRRGYLYDKAVELGCNKIALGHHFDDVIETTLLSILVDKISSVNSYSIFNTNLNGYFFSVSSLLFNSYVSLFFVFPISSKSISFANPCCGILYSFPSITVLLSLNLPTVGNKIGACLSQKVFPSCNLSFPLNFTLVSSAPGFLTLISNIVFSFLFGFYHIIKFFTIKHINIFLPP